MGLTLLIVAVVIQASLVEGEPKRRVCYYSGWAMYRRAPYNLMPADIDPNLCTHLVFAFATLEDNGTRLMTEDDNELPLYRPFTELKKQNPSLKTMIAVGGWNMGSELFINLVATDDSMRLFAANAIHFLRTHNFDGLDIDWEYPAARGSLPEDKQKFATLLQILSTAFDEESTNTGRDRLILSVAVGVAPSRVRKSYDVPAITRNVDFINLMMYDFHGSWETNVDVHSALYSDSGLSIDSSIKFWEDKGATKDKLVIGVPFYGPKYTLLNETDNQQGSEFNGSRTLMFYEICKLINDRSLQEQILDTERVPFLTYDDQWIGYDNVQSLTEKARYIHDNGYGGVMVWAIDLDDVTGSCGDGTYPLMRALFNVLQNDQIVG